MPKRKPSVYVNIFYFLVVYLLCFLLKNSALAAEKIYESLKLCAERLIPSLFPFMIMCSVTLNSGLGERVGALFGKPVALLLGISNEEAAVFVLGCLFGYPLGTKNAADLYKYGRISKKSAERLICFCSNTGPAFITGIAVPALGSTRLGWCIYLSQIASAFIIGLFMRKNGAVRQKQKPLSANLSPDIFIKAVSGSVLPMLNVCGFVVFFSCITCSVEGLLTAINSPPALRLLASGFIEITNGFASASGSPADIYTVASCAFFVGWSGLSVVLQGCSIASEGGLSCKGFVLSKLVQGCLTAIICLLFCKLFNLY